VNVAHQLQRIWVFPAEDRLVAILKEGTMPAMAAIVGDDISGEQPGHEGGQGDSARLPWIIGVDHSGSLGSKDHWGQIFILELTSS